MTGILIIDKPVGWTSHDVVARVRKLLGVRRVGHTGTLDPFATGVLVVLTGRATRLAQFMADAVKEYEATIRFGYATDTGDLTGTPRSTVSFHLPPSAWREGEVEAALQSLRGESQQVPPMYSAKKVEGRKLYEFARQGVEVERRPRPVIIHELEAQRQGSTLLQFNDDGTCDIQVRVVCSAGTYIRVLAESIGERLGTGAHLASLRRTRAGAFHIKQAIDLDGLTEMIKANPASVLRLLLSPDAGLVHLPSVNLTAAEACRAQHGMAIQVDQAVRWESNQQVRLHDEYGSLIGVGVYSAASNRLQPRVLLMVDAE